MRAAGGAQAARRRRAGDGQAGWLLGWWARGARVVSYDGSSRSPLGVRVNYRFPIVQNDLKKIRVCCLFVSRSSVLCLALQRASARRRWSGFHGAQALRSPPRAAGCPRPRGPRRRRLGWRSQADSRWQCQAWALGSGLREMTTRQAGNENTLKDK